MKKTKVIINDKEYILDVASTKSELRKGLMGVKHLDRNKGMLFDFGREGTHEMWMYNTPIPLDQIFINSLQEVTKVVTRRPYDENLVGGDEDTLYVVELNARSGVKVGDDLEFDDDEDLSDSKYNMKVLAPDGSIQMLLKGGERIFSRKNTKVLIRQAKKAYQSQSDSDFKRLGKSVFKFLDILNGNKPEYILVPE